VPIGNPKFAKSTEVTIDAPGHWAVTTLCQEPIPHDTYVFVTTGAADGVLVLSTVGNGNSITDMLLGNDGMPFATTSKVKLPSG